MLVYWHGALRTNRVAILRNVVFWFNNRFPVATPSEKNRLFSYAAVYRDFPNRRQLSEFYIERFSYVYVYIQTPPRGVSNQNVLKRFTRRCDTYTRLQSISYCLRGTSENETKYRNSTIVTPSPERVIVKKRFISGFVRLYCVLPVSFYHPAITLFPCWRKGRGSVFWAAKTAAFTETRLLNVSTECLEIRTKNKTSPVPCLQKDNDSFLESLRVPECIHGINRFKNDAQKRGIVFDPITVTHDIHNKRVLNY